MNLGVIYTGELKNDYTFVCYTDQSSYLPKYIIHNHDRCRIFRVIRMNTKLAKLIVMICLDVMSESIFLVDGKRYDDILQHSDILDVRWPDAEVSYAISQKFSPLERLLIETSMKYIKRKTCIDFIPVEQELMPEQCPDDTNGRYPIWESYHLDPNPKYIFIAKIELQKDMTGEFRHYIPIVGPFGIILYPALDFIFFNARKTITFRTVLHELFHTLGFVHEHQRLDRDNYITISKTLLGKHPAQFAKINNSNMTHLSYDYCSISHYDYGEHQRIQKVANMTETCKRSKYNRLRLLSLLDIIKINKKYGCYSPSKKIPLK